MADRITCQICGELTHSIQLHLREKHPDVTMADYKAKYPGAPLLSDHTAAKLKAAADKSKIAAISSVAAEEADTARRNLHEAFNLGKAKAALNAKGEGIPITVLTRADGFEDLIPSVDKGYIFNIELLKTALLGVELNIPTYLWGHAGTGKSTVWEQIAAHTGRPMLRIQHTVNTEEAHIVGQMLARDGSTYFEPGPLTVAMKYGLLYCADEYDFALPSVLSVYQPVLEGKTLIIKEAPPEWRVVRPHKNFRFVATGNTNGCGDETGLYQGTNIQNAANYERFGIVEEVKYMDASQESLIIQNQAQVAKEDADKLIVFATDVRKAYASQKIGNTISPRALINAAKLAVRRGSFRVGVSLSFSNRLTRIDREVVDGFAQRIFG